jgi:4-diphosphocytidyl-2-C-methyl-D-erythritol kinase
MKSHAKTNLALYVTSKRDDGYHNIETIFAPISIYDDIEITKIESGIEIECNNPDVPVNEGNIMHKVISYLKRKHKIEDGFKIKVLKRIPLEAGLGGGSSNGATVAK